MKKRGQFSETFLNAVFLTLSGGFQDAYTYFYRDRVFANAQTGNLVLMGAHLMEGSWGQALRYFVPLVSFIIGVLMAELIHRRYKYTEKIHWRQMILAGEISLLFLVGFLPSAYNLPANVLVSFVCAMQVQTFRKIRGYAYTSTMCIGNIRSGVEALCAYFYTKERSALKKAMYYFVIILLFTAGAALGNLATRQFGQHAIWGSCLLLALSFFFLFLKEKPTQG